MIVDDNGRTIVYDAFIRSGFLFIVSTYYHYRDKPITIVVDNVVAEEYGMNVYEPCRYFKVPISNTPTTLTINGKEYAITVTTIEPRSKGLAIATLFKDDYRYIPNMIQYYRAQGVKEFYLYYNGHELPNNLPKGDDIHYGIWDFKYWNHGNWHMNKEAGWAHNAQTTFLTMMQCKYMPDHTWMGFIDIDEYIYPSAGKSIEEHLTDSGNHAVIVNNHWACIENNKIIYNTHHTGNRTKTFYKRTFSGLVGIHKPKQSLVHTPTELKMFHMVNYQNNRMNLIEKDTQTIYLTCEHIPPIHCATCIRSFLSDTDKFYHECSTIA